MENLEMLLYISFIIYIMVIALAFIFKVKWLFMVGALLWFIPLVEIDNIFIKTVSVIMVLAHGVMTFYEPSESEW